MHELGIAQSLFEIVRQHVPDERGGTVRVVRIRVGRLAGVVEDSLRFCFEGIVSDTPFAGARLAIESVPVTCLCHGCRRQFPVDEPVFLCPRCGEGNFRILSGGELEVREIEVEDEPAEVP